MLCHGHLTFLPNLIIANASAIFNEKAALHTTSSLGFKGGYSAALFLLKNNSIQARPLTPVKLATLTARRGWASLLEYIGSTLGSLLSLGTLLLR